MKSCWDRIKSHSELRAKAMGMEENWDSVKLLIKGKERMKDIYSIEAAYLKEHPNSAYLIEIIGLETFPDYIDYLPQGAIPRKIKVMAYIPKQSASQYPYIAMSENEYNLFLDKATDLATEAIELHSTKL